MDRGPPSRARAGRPSFPPSRSQYFPKESAVPATQSRLEYIKNRTYLFLVLPALALYLFGVILPIVMGFRISLTDWNGFTPTMNFIGLDNYRSIFSEATNRFAKGQAAMFVTGTWINRNLKEFPGFDYGIFPFPGKKAGARLIFEPNHTWASYNFV